MNRGKREIVIRISVFGVVVLFLVAALLFFSNREAERKQLDEIIRTHIDPR